MLTWKDRAADLPKFKMSTCPKCGRLTKAFRVPGPPIGNGVAVYRWVIECHLCEPKEQKP